MQKISWIFSVLILLCYQTSTSDAKCFFESLGNHSYLAYNGSLRVCIPECHFSGTGFFLKKSRKSSILNIQEHPLPVPTQSRNLGLATSFPKITDQQDQAQVALSRSCRPLRCLINSFTLFSTFVIIFEIKFFKKMEKGDLNQRWECTGPKCWPQIYNRQASAI